jgi:signal transduction histidine kinase
MAHLAEMLEADRLPSGEATRTTYGMLVRDTHRLRRLVEDLLDFRRFETGAAALRLEPVDLIDLVRSVAADFEARRRRRFAPPPTGTPSHARSGTCSTTP